MTRNRRPPAWLILISVFCVLVGLLYMAIAIPSNRYAESTYQEFESENRKYLDLYKDRILADLEFLRSNPPFPLTDRQADATELILKWVPLEDENAARSVEETALETWQEAVRSLSTEEKFRDLTANTELLAKLNTDWINELQNFDHIDFYGSEPYQAHLESLKGLTTIARIGKSVDRPELNYKKINAWVDVHFAKLHLAGKTLEAFKTSRHVASLISTADSLLSYRMALRLLENEKAWLQVTGFTDWEPLSDEALHRYKRVSWAWGGLVNTIHYGKLDPEFAPYLNRATAFCSAISEVGPNFPLLAEFLEPRWLLEFDLTNLIEEARATEIDYLKRCGREDWIFLVEPTPLFARSPQSFVPFIRRVIAATLLQNSTPSYFKEYDNQVEAEDAESTL